MFINYNVNSIIMNQFPEELKKYFSTDSVEEQSDSEHQYPIEFLNFLTIRGLFSHKLLLKVGSLLYYYMIFIHLIVYVIKLN